MTDLPKDVEIEKVVLGCVMQKPELFRRLDVPDAAFYSELSQRIYRVMNDLDADGVPPDLVMVNSALRDQGLTCHAELAEMLDHYAFTRHFDNYLARLKQVAFRREAARIESECVALAADPHVTPDEIEQTRADRMRRARETYWPVERGMEPIEGWNGLREFYRRTESLEIRTGFPSLDDIAGDLYPQSVVTVLARPGVGKSLLGLNLAANWLSRPGDWGVLFASLEMGDTLATDRLIRITEG